MLPDRVIENVDVVLRTLFAPAQTVRPYPDQDVDEAEMSDEERQHALGNRAALQHAAQEEVEHLAWTERRIQDLGGRTSLLNPVWYASSLAVGVAAGMLGDKWNLGFLEETEHQVTRHLEEHLQGLPEQDAKSRAIVEQMRVDEMKHAHMAQEFGAAPLPKPVKDVMAAMSKVMTTISYKI